MGGDNYRGVELSKTILIKHTNYNNKNSPIMISDRHELYHELYYSDDEYFPDDKLMNEHHTMLEHCGINSGDWDKTSFLLREHGYDYHLIDSDFDFKSINWCVWVLEESC